MIYSPINRCKVIMVSKIIVAILHACLTRWHNSCPNLIVKIKWVCLKIPPPTHLRAWEEESGGSKSFSKNQRFRIFFELAQNQI